MAQEVTFGLLIPSFSSMSKHHTEASTLVRCSRQAEELGYDAVWVIDHFLKSPTYGQTWLDPLLTLTYVAAATTRIKLGTCILVAPLRNPVLLAKEVATLQFFSNERFILGLASGWNSLEFDGVQVPRKERGGRTDEIIEILRLLLTREKASFSGRYYQFPELAIEPHLGKAPPIWVGGGSQPMREGSSEPGERAAETVIQRIARADGWFAMPQGTPDLLAQDWERVQKAATAIGRDPAEIGVGQLNYVHVVETENRERAYSEQRRIFDGYMGEQRPWSFVQHCYLVGSIRDIVKRMRERAASGVRYFILGPATSDPVALERQLNLISAKVLPQVVVD